MLFVRLTTAFHSILVTVERRLNLNTDRPILIELAML